MADDNVVETEVRINIIIALKSLSEPVLRDSRFQGVRKRGRQFAGGAKSGSEFAELRSRTA